jgi:hypothetical protein
MDWGNRCNALCLCTMKCSYKTMVHIHMLNEWERKWNCLDYYFLNNKMIYWKDQQGPNQNDTKGLGKDGKMEKKFLLQHLSFYPNIILNILILSLFNFNIFLLFFLSYYNCSGTLFTLRKTIPVSIKVYRYVNCHRYTFHKCTGLSVLGDKIKYNTGTLFTSVPV